MQKQIDIIVTENDEFKDDVKDKGKEYLINDRYLGKGDISAYKFEQEELASDLSAPSLNQPRMMTIR